MDPGTKITVNMPRASWDAVLIALETLTATRGFAYKREHDAITSQMDESESGAVEMPVGRWVMVIDGIEELILHGHYLTGEYNDIKNQVERQET